MKRYGTRGPLQKLTHRVRDALSEKIYRLARRISVHGDRVLQGGFLSAQYLSPSGEVVQSLPLGENTLTYPFHIIVARLLARKASHVGGGVSFSYGTEGYDADDPVFPWYLYIGDDSSVTDPEQTALGNYITSNTTYPDPTATPLRYALRRILVHDVYADYVAQGSPIHVAFEWDIPLGTLRSGGDAETSPLTIHELGLHATDGADDYPIEGNPANIGDPQVPTASPQTLLARKVLSPGLPKIFDLSVTVRWEFRS